MHFDLWHYYGRTAKHGAFMGGADFVQWHGFYEINVKLAELKKQAEELRAARREQGRGVRPCETQPRAGTATWWGDPLAWVELFALSNIAFLAADVGLAHAVNAFAHPAEYVPVAFSLVAPAVLVAAMALGGLRPAIAGEGSGRQAAGARARHGRRVGLDRGRDRRG